MPAPTDTRRCVGVVGAGRMGGAFAALLVRSGHDVVVTDPDPAQHSRAAAAGSRVVEDVAAVVAAGADPVILSLATEAAFRDVVDALCDAASATRIETGDGATRPHRLVVVDTSTLHPATKEDGRRRLDDAGAVLLDCTVSGTGEQARHGDLSVYASGPKDVVAEVEPVLAAFSRRVFNVGSFGAGSVIKLLANLLVGVHNTAAAEMLAFAERAGVDPVAIVDVITDGAGQSRMLEQRGPGMARHEYGYGATVDLFRKDLSLINRFASEVGARTPLLDVVTRLYDRAAELGLGGEESAAVHRVYLDGG